MTSPELAELRTTALDRRAEAIAAVQQAQADLRLAHVAQIRLLRRKLAEAGYNNLIETVHGMGYRLNNADVPQ